MDKTDRYRQIDRLLKYEDGYTIKEILVRLEDEVSMRTLRDDIARLQKPPYSIKLDAQLHRGKERLYRYQDTRFSLFDATKEIKAQIDNIVTTLDEFKGVPQYDWMKFFFIELGNGMIDGNHSIISFDNNLELKGIEFVTPLAKAITHKQTLKLHYRKFDAKDIVTNIYPYHLRQFNLRWFLLAGVEDTDYISNYPLDRIISVEEISKPFKNTDIDFDEYFDDVVGVTIPETPIQKIELKVKSNRCNYIRTKPIHGSQREHKALSNDNYGYFSIDVKVNRELLSRLLSFGADIEILEPLGLRDNMKQIAQELNTMYSDGNK